MTRLRILSQEEVARLINSAPTPFYRLPVMTLYATGARCAEVARLQVGDSIRLHNPAEYALSVVSEWRVIGPQLQFRVDRYIGDLATIENSPCCQGRARRQDILFSGVTDLAS